MQSPFGSPLPSAGGGQAIGRTTSRRLRVATPSDFRLDTREE